MISSEVDTIMKWKTRRICSLFFAVTALAALSYLVVKGHFWLIALFTFWGTILAAGMLRGIASAPPSNWERKRHGLPELFVHAILLAFIFAPCLPVLWWEGLPAALASAGMTLTGAATVFTVSQSIFGPVGRRECQRGKVQYASSD